jgi:tetratricopeptide (TPR) repeat protein
MPCRYYLFTIIFVIINCGSLFHRPNEFEKGLTFYKQSNFYRACEHFYSYYVTHPNSDTTLYYLYDCYKRLNQPEQGIKVLEQLSKMSSGDKSVYFNLFYSYRKMKRWKNLYKLILDLPPPARVYINERYVLTRRLFAELISGATKKCVDANPVGFVISEGYMALFPDNRFYYDDIITNDKFIMLLDKLVEPVYPQKFLRMKNIPNNSYLYLPYMRLVHLGILDFNPDLQPDEHTLVTIAAKTIAQLKKRGIID